MASTSEVGLLAMEVADCLLGSNISGLLTNILCANETNSTAVISNVTAKVVDQRLLEFRDQSRFWVQRILVPLVMIIGVIGNSITIFIMTRRRMRSSTNIYLAALAIFDMLYLVFTFVLSISHYPSASSSDFYIYWKLRPFALMLTDACSNTSVWLTVTFTFERFIVVTHPIRGKVLCTESRAKKAILFVALFGFTCTLPTPFEWVVIEDVDQRTNETFFRSDFSDLGKNDLYKTIYYWLTVVMFIFIPLVLLAIFNSFLIRSVHISKKTRKTMTSRRDSARDSSTQENKITVMLIAVVILFFVCQLPTATILLYDVFAEVDADTNMGIIILGLGNVANFLMAVNAAGNFLLYCLLSQKYRRTFLQTFCPCLKGKITRLHSVYQHTVYTNVENTSPMLQRRSTSTRNSVEKINLDNLNTDYRKASVNDCSSIPLSSGGGGGGVGVGDCGVTKPLPSLENSSKPNCSPSTNSLPRKKRFVSAILDKLRRKSCSENESTQNWSNLNREKSLVRSVSEKWPTNKSGNNFNFD